MTDNTVPPAVPPSLQPPHSDDEREHRRGGFATRLLASAAVLALAGGVFTVSSLALFTDQESVTGNAFSTGSIDLVATPATVAITDLNMLPGDQVTAPLTVSNSGTLEFRYSMNSTTDEDVLASELVMTVKSGVTTCTDATWQADGVVLYSGVLGSTTTANVMGDVATGAQAGDRVLASAAAEELCFNVTLPASATNAVAGLASTAIFTFDAEQTANNP